MLSSAKMGVSVVSVLLAAGMVCRPASAQSTPPAVVGEEVQRVRTDFVNGGATRLYANWTRCVAKARDTNDANVAGNVASFTVTARCG